MWTCDIWECHKPAVRRYGECILCDRHLCFKHLQPEFHKCPEWQNEEAYEPASRDAEKEEMSKLLQKIDTAALATRASHLRSGIRCSVPSLQYDRSSRNSVMGGMNYHVEIHFEEGISWLARIRRCNATSPTTDLRDYIIRSEVATLQFLEKTKVPAPRVFDFAFEGKDNPVGVGYILMENMHGKALRWSLMSPAQRKKVMSQLADIFIELQTSPFDSMGSLDRPGTTHVGGFAQESLTDFTGPEMRLIGPCSSLEKYFSAMLSLIIDLIMRGESYPQRAVDAYLIHRSLLDSIPAILSHCIDEDRKFYLKHADDKGDHILVDDEYNITGIIDREWAYTTSKTIAFNSPIALLPVDEFYNGNSNLSDDETVFGQLLEDKGSPQLADIVRKGRIYHRFAFCCGYDLSDWSGFVGLFQGFRSALLGRDEGLTQAKWRETVLYQYRDDDRLKILLSNSSSKDDDGK
ncbi:MAG: hypothetical protein M1834_009348 [Cirrosporium novae-zelandiae]|nr:MAG: hypothetical protein M1834_009348 [Cirrosporium novae-zelandiae]